MHFDGSKMKSGLGADIVLTSPKGDKLGYVLQINFASSNNVAEYEGLVHGIRLAKEIGIRHILCYGDSDLVVQQCTGNWDAKDANMANYRFLVQQLCGFFDACELHHVPCANNEAADALSMLGSTQRSIPAGVSLEHIKKPSIKPSLESESIFIPASLEALDVSLECIKKPSLKPFPRIRVNLHSDRLRGSRCVEFSKDTWSEIALDRTRGCQLHRDSTRG